MVTGDPGARSLVLTLEFDRPVLGVTIAVTGVEFQPGSVVAQLPVDVAGLPTLSLDQLALQASDDVGPLPVKVVTSASDGEDAAHTWHAVRATAGTVRLCYLARPHDDLPVGAHPPLDLREEDGGLSGTGHVFLALPPLDGPFDVSVRWRIQGAPDLSGVCSFGTGDLELGPTPLERLLDCHFVVGAVSAVQHPLLPVSAHFLTRPSFDVEPFVDHTARTHSALAATFGEPAPEFRIFFRHNPHHRGLGGAALSRSFVAGWNENTARTVEDLEAFIDHELVHEWVGIDGTYDEVVWHNEGLADYYGILLPFRAGMVGTRSFLARVNRQARLAFANVYRDQPLDELRPIYWQDFRAQQEPYYRGFFYFAQLDHALRTGPASTSLDGLVRDLRDRRRAGGSSP